METGCLSVKCLEPPAGLPGTYIAQGAMEQNQVRTTWPGSRSMFIPQEGHNCKSRKSWFGIQSQLGHFIIM